MTLNLYPNIFIYNSEFLEVPKVLLHFQVWRHREFDHPVKFRAAQDCFTGPGSHPGPRGLGWPGRHPHFIRPRPERARSGRFPGRCPRPRFFRRRRRSRIPSSRSQSRRRRLVGGAGGVERSLVRICCSSCWPGDLCWCPLAIKLSFDLLPLRPDDLDC